MNEYVHKSEIEKIIEELYQEFHKLDMEIDIYNGDNRNKVDMMQEIGWVVGKLETLLEGENDG